MKEIDRRSVLTGNPLWYRHRHCRVDRHPQSREISAFGCHQGWYSEAPRPRRGGWSNCSRASAPSPPRSQLALLVAQGTARVWLALVTSPHHTLSAT